MFLYMFRDQHFTKGFLVWLSTSFFKTGCPTEHRIPFWVILASQQAFSIQLSLSPSPGVARVNHHTQIFNGLLGNTNSGPRDGIPGLLPTKLSPQHQ